jgi:hypothetical protein
LRRLRSPDAVEKADELFCRLTEPQFESVKYGAEDGLPGRVSVPVL